MADPVLLASADGILTYANPVALEWLSLDAPLPLLPLTEVLARNAESPISTHDLQEVLTQKGVWSTRVRYRGEQGKLREGRLRVSRVLTDGTEPEPERELWLAQIQDLSEEFTRLRAEAARERANLLLDLLGTTASELGFSIGALSWAADLEDSELGDLPAALRAPMTGLRVASRRLTGLFENLGETYQAVPGTNQEPAGDPPESAPPELPTLRVFTVGSSPVEAARLLDDLRRAKLRCLLRPAKNREELIRAAVSGEADAVIVGEDFSPEGVRLLVRTLAESAPAVPVFDRRGVDTEFLVQGIRGAVLDRRRVENVGQAWRSLEEIALRDPLTSTLNRRALDRFGRLELSRARRYQLPLTVAIFDLDNFKAINDQLGHGMGDRALQVFASALQAGVREMDFVARLGGDEFVVLMPHTAAAGGLVTVQRLRDAGERLLRERIPPLQPRPGVSAGLAVFPDQDVTSLDALIARADEALYRAKASSKGATAVSQAPSSAAARGD